MSECATDLGQCVHKQPARAVSHSARRSIAAIVAVCSLAASSALAAEPIDERLRMAMASQDSVRVWVFLADKQLPPGTPRPAPGAFISPRAAARIALRGQDVSPELDWPVNAEYVSRLDRAGLRVRVRSRWLNAASGWAGANTIEAIADFPFVDSIRRVGVYRRSLPQPIGFDDESLPDMHRQSDDPPAGVLDYGRSVHQIRQLQVDRAHRDSFDGTGILIGFLDTGYNTEHTAFSGMNIVATHDFINGDEIVTDSLPVAAQTSHGTGTLSICGGFEEGFLIGPAHRASYCLAKTERVNEEVETEEDDWIAGIEWCDSVGADIVSSSLGYLDWYETTDMNGVTAPVSIAADIAVQSGIVVVNAAGNQGNKQWRTLIAPADAFGVIAVGAVTQSEEPSGFTSFGPTADGRLKPELSALGSNTWQASSNGGYRFASGTSFATPLIAGCAALLLQQDTARSPDDIRNLLIASATHPDNWDERTGYGVPQMAIALGIDTTTVPLPDDFIRPYVYPNPSPGAVTFRLHDEESRQSWVTVFTAAGTKIVEASDTRPNLTWDGLNEADQPVASGVYIAVIEVEGRKTERIKFAIIRDTP